LRGFYQAPLEDCILDKVGNTINAGFEEQYFSLTYFFKLLKEGQSVAIDILCAPPEMILIDSSIYQLLRENRHLFFTKNMKVFVNFARGMVSKYSLRIERLQATENLIKLIDKEFIELTQYHRLLDIWDKLPENEYFKKSTNDRNKNDSRTYVVCGRELQVNLPLRETLNVLNKIKESYGERVLKAKNNSYDYKGIYSAFRAIYSIKSILETGDLQFPLKQGDYLREIRLGKYHFINDGLQEHLDNLLLEVDNEIERSNLPDKAPKEFCDNIILEAYNLKNLGWKS
jgi:hypothetical protein